MAVTYQLPFTQSFSNIATTIVNADGAVGATMTNNPSNTKTLFTANANGGIVKSLMVTGDDTTIRVLTFYISNDGGTTKVPIGTASIPVNAGATGAIATVDIFNTVFLLGFSVDQAGRNVLPLAAAALLYVGTQVAVTAAKFINVTGVAENL